MGVEGVARTELRLLFFQEEGGMRVVEMFRGLGRSGRSEAAWSVVKADSKGE